MKEIITKDGSSTFFNDNIQDYYHSKSGAAQEAREKYANALKIKPNKIIFDICFGIGYNSAAALEIGPATVHCFENDKEILHKILDLNTPFKNYPLIKEFVKSFLNGNSTFIKDKTALIMHFGDARLKIKYLSEKADYILFDAFSPSKQPELWTEQFFKDIKSKMNSDAKLATYSCAGWVRKNMQNAGFIIEDGPIVGTYSPGTIATLK
jgi:predicted methyltransferase